jgi:hypothetical protein
LNESIANAVATTVARSSSARNPSSRWLLGSPSRPQTPRRSRLSYELIAVFEAGERASHGGGVRDVVGVPDRELDDRVVDLGLVEPAGVHGVWTRIRVGERLWRRSMLF